jgi:hypothetical protein
MEILVVLGALALLVLVCKFNSSTSTVRDEQGRSRGYTRTLWNPDPNYITQEYYGDRRYDPRNR